MSRALVAAVEPMPGARCRLTLATREVAARAQPGQFVMVAVPSSVLRHPFWIAGTGEGTIDLLIDVVGPGTAWLARRLVGERLDLLGPLGRAFAGAIPSGHVALTPPMACGTGLCWTCAVPMRDGPPARACIDGPMFDAELVDWDAWAHKAPDVEADAPNLAETDVDLAVDLGPVRLANPILAAAGTATGDLPGAERLGALVAKTVTLLPRDGRPGPRMVETAGGMLNAIGLQNPGVEAWVGEVLPTIAAPVIASIAGETAAEYGRVVARLPGAPSLLAVEANISCPNIEDRGRVFACHPRPAAEAVAAAAAATDLPVFAKLTADVTDITEVAAAVMEAGAAGVTVANTLLGLAIDVETRRPRLGGGTGGLSGPAVKPVALRAVAQVAAALPGVPIIGVGGVRTVTDVIEYVLAGASAVAIGTASFANPRAAADLVDALPGWLAARGHRTLTELRGQLRW